MAEESRALIEYVSDITEFNDISQFMNDKELDLALGYVVKLIAKPDMNPAAAARAIVQLQALSAKFAMMQKHYITFGTKSDSPKKNIYYTAEHKIDELVSALKYYLK